MPRLSGATIDHESQPQASGSSNTGHNVSSSQQRGVINVSDNGSFIHKPPRGWLHPDDLILGPGMVYGVRYIGCLEVNTSMKSLDFETRSLIAKESINRVCEMAGLKTTDKRRKVEKRISRMLAASPCMDHAGSNITLTITSGFLNLAVLESGESIAKHEMPNISFASGGDADTLDFVAYVAKDRHYGRACFILECGGGLAQDVITTVGQAFELRFKEFLQGGAAAPPPNRGGATNSSGSNSNKRTSGRTGSTTNNNNSHRIVRTNINDPPDYYNDLPGKVPPPDTPPPVPPLPAGFPHSYHSRSQSQLRGEPSIENLIDLTSDLMGGLPSTTHNLNANNVNTSEHNYVNDSIINGHLKSNKLANNKDPFDMQPFSQALVLQANPPIKLNSPPVSLQKQTLSTATTSSMPLSSSSLVAARGATASPKGGGASPKINNKTDWSSSANKMNKTPLQEEAWFHGTISRKESEDLVSRDGDYLVRESLGSPGQYVLTGMQSGARKHLLLVDPEGVVRTKDRTFESVSHLIHYHSDNGLPIISAESTLVLEAPVFRSKDIK